MTKTNIAEKLEHIRQLVEECLRELDHHTPADRRRKAPSTAKRAATPHQLDFSVNERAFVKTYARSLSGPKKFVLIVAYLAKGQSGKEIDVKDVQQHWNRMKSSNLLGCKFNHFYTNAAKENGWVDTKKKGAYLLTKSWQEVLRK